MNSHRQDGGQISPLTLERAAQGKLTADEFDALGPDAAEHVARLSADSEAVLQQYPPEREVAQILRKAEALKKRKRPTRQIAWAAAAAPAFAVALLVLMPATDSGLSDPLVMGERTKGPAILQVYRQTSAGQERLRTGAAARAGDVLQLRFDARGRAFGAIVSVDGAGVITAHLPQNMHGPAAKLDSTLITIEEAYELDDAPQFERFFLVTSAQPFEMRTVQAAIEALNDDPTRVARAPLGLGPDIEQVSLQLVKASP